MVSFFPLSFFSWWLFFKHFSCHRNRILYFLDSPGLKSEVLLDISPFARLTSTTDQEMGLDGSAGDRHIPLEQVITFFHIGAKLGNVVESY